MIFMGPLVFVLPKPIGLAPYPRFLRPQNTLKASLSPGLLIDSTGGDEICFSRNEFFLRLQRKKCVHGIFWRDRDFEQRQQ